MLACTRVPAVGEQRVEKLDSCLQGKPGRTCDDSVEGRVREVSRVMAEHWQDGGTTHQDRKYGRRSMSGREDN